MNGAAPLPGNVLLDPPPRPDPMRVSGSLALVGDPSPGIVAHRAIPLAPERAREQLGVAIDWTWVRTRGLPAAPSALERFAGFWAVPGSPYENPAGVLETIRFARETGRPFLGTCGGSQHALIGFARNVAGIAGADHAGLRFGAFDSDESAGGDVLGAELPEGVHPFYFGTLFQPERAALRGGLPPLIRAFLPAMAG